MSSSSPSHSSIKLQGNWCYLMEAWKLIRIYLHLLVGSSFIFPNYVYCLSDQCSSSEVGSIMNYYYERFESFNDSNFHNFISQEHPFNSCELLSNNIIFTPNLSVLQRNLIGEGSHRRLSSFLSLNIHPPLTTELPFHCSEIIMIERLPSGIFADPFELEHLHRLNVFDDVAVFGDTNLELPTILSNRTVLEVHKNVDHDVLLSNENRVDISIQLPLHARYPPLNESGYAEVRFDEPILFLNCEMKNQRCLIQVKNGGKKVRNDDVLWRIAAGRKGDSLFVSLFTFISALLSAFSIVLTAICLSEIKQHDHFKRS